MSDQEYHFETEAIRTQAEVSPHGEHSVPLYLTSSFVFDDAEEMRAAFADEVQRNIYSRFSNPNSTEFIDKLCKMEGAEAGYAFASGMAAVFSTFAALLNSGDEILSCRSIFGSTHTVFTKIFPKWNIKTVYAPIQDLSEWEAKITANTKMIYIETPSNPGVDLIDIEAVAALAKKHDLLLVVDNCFATPYLQQPIKWGADLVIHSATKFMDGQGRVLGGATVGRADLIKQVHSFSRSTGPALSPFNAWVLSKSLETLAVRMDRHSENAVKIAEFLEAHDDIEMVKYPFLPSHPGYAIAKKQMKAGGGVVTFSVKGGLERGKRFLNNIHLCSLTANLGDSRTIVTHPASTTHAKLTEEDRLASDITPGLIRISVGLEHHEDILADVEQALIASC
jgi:O-succinylhomoserine sulfhydrylase